MSDETPDETPTPDEAPSLAKSKFFSKARAQKPGPKPKLPPVALSMEMLQQILAGLQPSRETPPELLAALEAMKVSAAANAQLHSQVRNQVRPSNPKATGLSAFTTDSRCDICQQNLAALAAGRSADLRRHREGDDDYSHPKPTLRYETTFCGIPQRAEDLTPLEVELFNSFTESKEAHGGKWTAILDRDGTKRRLKVRVPCASSDEMTSLPPLTQILMELLYGESVGDPVLAMAEMQALRREVAALKAAQVPA